MSTRKTHVSDSPITGRQYHNRQIAHRFLQDGVRMECRMEYRTECRMEYRTECRKQKQAAIFPCDIQK
jgi:hypothetical protein